MKNRKFSVVFIVLILTACSSVVLANGVRRVSLKANKPLSEQLTIENATYVIKSDFDLNGDTVVIPKGSTLKFSKGVLTNGVLVGQGTKIESSKKKRFGKNLKIIGAWNVETAYSEWFDPRTDGSDDTEALTAFFNFPAAKKILKAGEYGVTELFCDKLQDCEIYAYGATLRYLRTDLDHIPGDHAVLANYKGTIPYDAAMKGYIRIYGLTIDGNSQNFVYDPTPKKYTPIINHHTLRLVLNDEVDLKDCTFKNSFMTAVVLDICKKSIVDHCTVVNSGESVSYKPVGVWYTWEGFCLMDKVYTDKGWKETYCESCVVKDSYFENIGGSFASANCRVFECYDNTVKDNRGYAFELSRAYKDRVVDIHDNVLYGVGSSAINMTYFKLPDESTNTVKIYRNKFYDLCYDSHRTQPCAKAFLMVYRNKGERGTGILDVTIKDNLFELAPTASQGLVRSDRFVFEGNTCTGYVGEKHSALFFCGNDENIGSYYIRNNIIESMSGAVSIIRSPKYLEVSGNNVKTSLSPAIVYVQGNERMNEATYKIFNNEVDGVAAMAYVSSSPKMLEITDNVSGTIKEAITRPTSDVQVNCRFGGNSFMKVSGGTKNIKIIENGK